MNEESELPEEFPDLDSDEIRKKVKLSYDGRQLMIRIPREITEFYNLKRGDIIEFTVKITSNTSASIRETPITLKILEGAG